MSGERSKPVGGDPASIPLPARIDHTLLRPEATYDQIAALAEEAVRFEMAAAVVLPGWVTAIRPILEPTPVALCTVVGFPLAHELPSSLESAAAGVAAAGADEIDMVVSTGALLSGRAGDVAREIEAVVRAAAREREGCIVKVILETHLLDDGHLTEACRLVEEGGGHFVKTTTGFTGGGATPHEVERLKELVGDRLGVKASAGIRTLAQAEALVAAGADRLGTSSGVAIASDWKEREEHAHTG